MLSLTASIIETLLVKSSVFAINQVFNLASFSTYSLYNWYCPTLSDTEILQKEVIFLRNEISDMRAAEFEHRVIVLE